MGVAQAIGQRVRQAMAERGISQERVAEALGLPQSQVSRRLDGQIVFKVSELAMIADMCEVPAASFFSEPERAA